MLILLAGCEGDDGTDGRDGESGADGLTSIIVQTQLPEDDANCPYGGTKIETGLDTNRNGDLDAGEVADVSYVCNGSEYVKTRLGGAVINFGLTNGDSETARAIGERIQRNILETEIAATVVVDQTQCSPDLLNATSGILTCYDANVFYPAVPERQWDFVDNTLTPQVIAEQILEDASLGVYLNYVEAKGVAWGQSNLANLFTVRQLIKDNSQTASARVAQDSLSEAAMKALPASDFTVSATTSGTTTEVEHVLVTSPTTYVFRNEENVERSVYAPDYNGSGFTNTDELADYGLWVMTGLGVSAKDKSIFCLRADFLNLVTGNKVTLGDSESSCGLEHYVTLDTSIPQLATGMHIDIESNDVKGLSLFHGTPNTVVDPIYPDFLTDVSPQSVVTSGTTYGYYAPPTSYYDSTYPYVVVGVDLSASKNYIKHFTVHLARLTAPGPSADDLWNSYAPWEIEAAVVETLNTVYDALADQETGIEFEIYDNCPSTIATLNFCDNLQASDSYSSTDWDSACGAVCDVAYDSCKVSKDACEATVGLFDSGACKYGCSSTRDSCYNGCSTVVSGSAKVQVKNVKGLERLTFTDATIPFLADDNTIAVEIDAEVSNLAAEIYWKLTQSGITVDDTLIMDAQDIRVSASALITAESCPSGSPALYLTVENVTLLNANVWDVQGFVDSVVGVVSDSLDWLADNISDLFYYDLQSDYDAALEAVVSEIETLLNQSLSETAILPCASA